jgi:hypothetical protein
LRRRYPTARFRLMGIGLDATGPVAAWARERAWPREWSSWAIAHIKKCCA